MNIKRFVAPDMREGLTAVRASLGEDAVILSSRRVADGVEIVAAMDYSADDGTALADDTAALSSAALDQLASDSLAGTAAAPRHREPSFAYGHLSPEPPAAVMPEASDRAGGAHLHQELRDLRRLLESQLASLAWSDVDR